LEVLAGRTFSRRDFVERPNGHVRLAPSLARVLTAMVPDWRRALGPHAEHIAKVLGRSGRPPAGEPAVNNVGGNYS
jgi:hypothetical protein